MEDVLISIVNSWDTGAVADLYRAGGWWKDEWDPAELTSLMQSSFAFAIAHTATSRYAVGMGRVISDGVSDAYIQDLVVIPEWRGQGIGKKILSALISYCHDHHITWIGLIAEPGTTNFYKSMGFSPLEGYIPMKLTSTSRNRVSDIGGEMAGMGRVQRGKRQGC